MTSAEIADVSYHYVISMLLTVSNAWPTRPRPSALLVCGVFPYAGGRPDGGLMPSTAAKADGAPIV